jgi:hypothetical protein
MSQRNICKEGADVTEAGRLFQVLASATGNALSPTLDRRVDGTTRSAIDDERSRLLEGSYDRAISASRALSWSRLECIQSETVSMEKAIPVVQRCSVRQYTVAINLGVIGEHMQIQTMWIDYIQCVDSIRITLRGSGQELIPVVRRKRPTMA